MGDDFLKPEGKKKKSFFVAHRRSPSELTPLMVEQLNIQRQQEIQKQLDLVEQQKQTLLAQQQLAALQPPLFQLPYNPGLPKKNHRRSQSSIALTGLMGSFSMPQVQYSGAGTNFTYGAPLSPKPPAHQRSGSGSGYGHARRQLLGLDQAKKAAAAAKEGSPLTPPDPPKPQFEEVFSLPVKSSPGEFLFPAPQPGFQGQPGFQALPRRHERKGSGHYRSNLRADMSQNWRSPQQPLTDSLAPPAFTPSHRPKNSFSGQISSAGTIAQYGGYTGYNQQQRKSLFAPYLPQALLPGLIAEGRLVTGVLRVNKKNRSDAYVATDGLLDADIFICGSKDRNRALEGDLVAVELLVVDEVWSQKKEKEEKKRRKDAGNGDGPRRRGLLKQRPTQKKNDDLEVEGQLLLLVEEEEISDTSKPLYAGHVVAVIDRIPGQLFAGTLGLLRPLQQGKESVNTNNRPKIVWFKPNDKKVPLIAIPTEQAPKDFVEKHETYADRLFVASIKRWPITLLHPFGTLVSELGVVDTPETEIGAILKDNNFLCDEFPDNAVSVLKEFGDQLPKELSYLTEYRVPELDDRRDFFQEYVFALAPANYADVGIHIKKLDQGRVELGVHVSDVTSFVEAGLVLDKKLKKRNVVVVLAQGVTKSLMPENILKEVSLETGKKSPVLLVVFRIETESFEIEDVWVGEAVVAPKLVVTYKEMDAILEGKSCAAPAATQDYVRTLALFLSQFRRRRLGSSVPVRGLPLLDNFDEEALRSRLNLFDESQAQSAVQELFHKVNATVAQRIFTHLGDKTLLRRQQLPTLQKFETFTRRAAPCGPLDTTDSASLQRLLAAMADPRARQAASTLLSKCMNRGKYFVAGRVDPENYGHWFYNIPLYTHFTSPTSRYADLIVHRQLKAVLRGESYNEDVESLKMVAEYCNFKKDSAHFAQEQLMHLLLCQTINAMLEKTGQVLTMGRVVQVYELAFDVLLPEFGIEKRVHGDQLPLVKAEFDKEERVLELYWETGVDLATYVPPDEKQPLSYRLSIKNKFRTGSVEAVKQGGGEKEENFKHKLASLGLEMPKVLSPDEVEGEPKEGQLGAYFKQVVTKEGAVQEVREMQEVPILLRSEIGMAIPCLTVRTLNPFA